MMWLPILPLTGHQARGRRPASPHFHVRLDTLGFKRPAASRRSPSAQPIALAPMSSATQLTLCTVNDRNGAATCRHRPTSPSTTTSQGTRNVVA
ncbi:uncharacterized protein M421DRAFT_271033 [Didymella exigua CBS 183.55]|uniref:Uncharacterized protein n=1 Tax=Didymella exigua CBS 183.55 TaxID=1150837 RepID=A0A6A5RGQ0_9PLEO|nr:uncharacterized protein M421DRAFT_271033 [Didymella exigua CBS 183.55]KAF1924797.1 hypothetical protein M421DRAFT_271033 [Didymella exigua CBS 183.55]